MSDTGIKFLERAQWVGGGPFTHLLSSPALGQGLSSPHPGTSQHEDSDFPATGEGTGGQRGGEACPGDTAGDLRAAARYPDLPDPSLSLQLSLSPPIITVVLLPTC